MAVDILSIAPPDEQRQTVLFAGQEVEIRPLRMTQIARLAQRFEGFRKAFFSANTEDDMRGAAMLEAWPAIICAGLGKDKSAERPLIEAHIEKFSQEEQMRIGQAVLALTNPEARPANDNAPLPDSAAVIADAVAANDNDPSTTSSSPSNT